MLIHTQSRGLLNLSRYMSYKTFDSLIYPNHHNSRFFYNIKKYNIKYATRQEIKSNVNHSLFIFKDRSLPNNILDKIVTDSLNVKNKI